MCCSWETGYTDDKRHTASAEDSDVLVCKVHKDIDDIYV